MLLSLRRRGQLLLALCVLAGAVVGAGCGMLVESAQAPNAFAAPAWERGSSAVAAGSSGRAAFRSRTAASGSQVGEASTMSRTGSRTGSPERADRQKAGKHGKHQKHDRGKGKRGKDE